VATQFETAILEEANEAAWDALVAAAPCGTVFQSTRWLRIVARAFGRTPRVIGVFRNGTLVGGCPVYERRLLGFLVSDPPLLAGYAGPVLHLPDILRTGRVGSEAEQTLAALEQALRARYASVRIVAPPGLTDARPFLWAGWAVVPRYTYRLALRPREALIGDFEQGARRRARRGEAAGWRAVHVSKLDGSENTYASAYRRHGAGPPVPQSILRALLPELLKAGLARASELLDPTGRAHAFEVHALDERAAYALLSGTDEPALRDGGAVLLKLEAMHDVGQRVSEFDFLGANTPSIATFKRAFGGTLTPYWEASRTTAAAVTLLGARRLLARATRPLRRSG